LLRAPSNLALNISREGEHICHCFSRLLFQTAESSLATSIKETVELCLLETRGPQFCNVREQYYVRPGKQLVPKLSRISSPWIPGNMLKD